MSLGQAITFRSCSTAPKAAIERLDRRCIDRWGLTLRDLGKVMVTVSVAIPAVARSVSTMRRKTASPMIASPFFKVIEPRERVRYRSR